MAYWWFAAAAFDKRLGAENGREIAPGMRLSFASRQIAGFPFRIDALLDGLKIDIATSYGPLTWRSEHFALHMLTYARSRQLFEAAGKQSLSWTDAEGGHHQFDFVPGSLQASAIESHDALARFDLDIIGIGSPDISGARAQFHIRREADHDALDFVVSGEDLHLAPDLHAGFGDEIKRLSVEGKLTQAAPLAPLLAGQSDWRAVTESWRRHGGTLLVQTIGLKWNHDSANGTGQLSLDDGHRIRGTINLTAANQPLPYPWNGTPISTVEPLY